MTRSLANLVNNLFEGIHRTKCKLDMMMKNVSLAELNIGIATVFLNTQVLKII